MSSSFIGQSNEKGGAYASLFYTVLTMSFRPIWPLDKTRCQVTHLSLLINKQMNLPLLIKGKFKSISCLYRKTADLTPEGEFTIMIKAKDPYYRRKNIEGGAKNNPLGRRWIDSMHEEQMEEPTEFMERVTKLRLGNLSQQAV